MSRSLLSCCCPCFRSQPDTPPAGNRRGAAAAPAAAPPAPSAAPKPSAAPASAPAPAPAPSAAAAAAASPAASDPPASPSSIAPERLARLTRPAGITPPPRFQVVIPPSAPWQADDGAWHTSVRATIRNMDTDLLRAGWTLGLKVPDAVAVDKDWNWESTLQDGLWSGKSTKSWQAIGRRQTTEVGGDLKLSGKTLRVTEATINGERCQLAFDV